MSTLTTEYSNPVKVAQVFADFRHGMPSAGTVYVGAERHRVQIYRTIGGLMGRCPCPGGCGAIPEAIRAFGIMAEAWRRTPRRRVGAMVVPESWPSPMAESDTQPEAIRPYDGLARATCEADLVPMAVPAWAYDERGIRRPAAQAEVARALWLEIQRAFDRVLGKRPQEFVDLDRRIGHDPAASDGRRPVSAYYRASWEPDRGMTRAAFGPRLEVGLDEESRPEAAA